MSTSSPETQPNCGELVNLVRKTEGTPTRKLIAVLSALGLTDTAEQASVLGLTERAIRKARNHSSGTTVPQPRNHSSAAEPQFRNPGTPVPPERNHSSENGTTVPPSRARVLNNSLFFYMGESEKKKKKDPPPPKRERPVAKPNVHLLALEAFQAWNDTALRCGLPQAAKLTPARIRSIGARLAEYGPEGWKQALANIERSSFLTGTNDRGWKADLDFLCQAKSFGKVHDGGYGNGRHAQQSQSVTPGVFDDAAHQPSPDHGPGKLSKSERARRAILQSARELGYAPDS